MDFAVMGTINSYIKQKNLSFAAKHKIRTGQSLTNANGNLVSMSTSTFDKLCAAAKTSTDQVKQQKMRRIKQKLKSGQKLSDEELGFLRVNDPNTYKKAKHAAEAREELKSELKKAKSKAEAREAMTRAMVKASADAMAEISALGQAGGGVNAQGASFGGETSAATEGNVDGADNQTFTDANQSIQSTGEHATETLSETNLANHDDDTDNKFTHDDIMEKYIWTIRALQNEWQSFTNSKSYKDLPDQIVDEIIIKRRQIVAATAYRKAMHLMDR